MSEITLWNSLTKAPATLDKSAGEPVSLYVCGPTVYDRAHLGNARSAVVFDQLYRLLRHDHPGAVKYVRNFTDVDDKINARAAETGRPISQITDETTGWYLGDMGALGVLEPDEMPRATQHIGSMIAMIERLVLSGHAYEAEGHVLFSVSSYPEYGRLSRRSVEDMIAGARVEVAPYKRDPMDFVLWKPSGADLPGWDSPWGRGRPGWHIECSAMSYELLGPSFDIHGGGSDLTFPHHENEIAQSRCAHPEGGFARIWMHNEMLRVEGRKMSKSLGNFFTVRDLLDEGIPGEVIRFVILGTHYRKPMDWTGDKAGQAKTLLRRWRQETAGAEPGQIPDAMLDILRDDLNVPGFVAGMHELSRDGNAPALLAAGRLIGILTEELGAWAEDRGEGEMLAELARAMEAKREAAKASKDFSAVDQMKTDLAAAGVEVRMSREGIELVAGEGFDPARLDALAASGSAPR
ncbi:cysteine--tRNA ligase [Tropicimonas sp. IMCC34011]|uniref:cysteine--tRNA ligase n=1 Tax=Tropicimonas sp. IMCC34011 TaxID=2248759 RepID=UPI000E271A48|nr:cysteine--tRNA ligase [Tropicimonas sp. IMCC34011]